MEMLQVEDGQDSQFHHSLVQSNYTLTLQMPSQPIDHSKHHSEETVPILLDIGGVLLVVFMYEKERGERRRDGGSRREGEEERGEEERGRILVPLNLLSLFLLLSINRYDYYYIFIVISINWYLF